MSASQFDDITKKIDKHFEKTGVVLVGMHQELQEQKQRIGQAAGERDRFRSDSTALVESIKDQIALFSSETGKLLKQFSDQQAQSITASSNENRVALQAIAAEQAGLLASAQNVFRESIAKSEENLSTHMNAHKRFLKSSYDELSERQRASDTAFAALKVETERRQAQQIAFAKKTRLIIGALVVSGFAVVAIQGYGKVGVL